MCWCFIWIFDGKPYFISVSIVQMAKKAFFLKEKVTSTFKFAFKIAGIMCFEKQKVCFEEFILWCTVVIVSFPLATREISCNVIYLFYMYFCLRRHIMLVLTVSMILHRKLASLSLSCSLTVQFISIFRCQFNFSRSSRCPCVFVHIFIYVCGFRPFGFTKHIHLSGWISTIYFYVTYYSFTECICYVSAFAHDQPSCRLFVCLVVHVCTCTCRVRLCGRADFYGFTKISKLPLRS